MRIGMPSSSIVGDRMYQESAGDAGRVMTGQHTGAFNGIEPTGKPIDHKQVHIFTIVDGQITHHRAVRDDLGLLLQLGWRPGG
jgi:predicted ester cyclase